MKIDKNFISLSFCFHSELVQNFVCIPPLVTPIFLPTELSQVDALRLACLHNKQDEVHAHLCGQDKVKFIVMYFENLAKAGIKGAKLNVTTCFG